MNAPRPIKRDGVEKWAAAAIIVSFVLMVLAMLYAELNGIVLSDSAAWGGVSMLIVREMAGLVISRSKA